MSAKKQPGKHHPTVLVSRGEVEIDEKLAPLIRLLWARGINTNECCQEDRPGTAYIEFPGTGDVEKFLNVAQKRYRVELQNWNEGVGGELSIRVRLLVYFPTRDIPRLVKVFTRR
jgi:hypothetical protein